ncbi:NAD(P)/FAD-dependent oxidoreductase [Ornithinimicrobium sp. F0845]|uniref:flavin-containing monooxygenase n=1 Tax=Ornithinimicrobium sp. F0845 TaxID=2926412 RepID=UPI001FF15910|nr:NAD(P)/FAD-dependent oxidoreductase [Ornithinimicrobium sp. F0845]MCK0110685.1 NAD(P)/FAD-dependent oxidoreductase [Ornithinimicrobium sp. F0845]
MDDEVMVIGGGPGGLSCAAELGARGVSATVLERGDGPGAAWARRYDALRFNTSRRNSHLPGAPFPREWGQFPTRDHYVDYLRQYAEARRVRVRTGVDVGRLDPVDDMWRVTTSQGEATARHVVVATGLANRPVLPGWAHDPAFGGTVLHPDDYRNPAPFQGQDVVVVGAGSSGLELSHDLATGGAGRVSLAIRTPPNILFREVGGAPSDLPVPLFLHLPDWLVDRMLAALQRRVVGDLTAYGLPPAPEGAITGLKRRGAGTAVVDPEVIDSIREGLIRVVPAATGLDADGVVLAGGQRLRADVVLVATGYATGLEPLAGHLDVLDDRGMPWARSAEEALPGLRFVGYVYRPGLTGFVGRQARRVAREIAARGTATPPARDGWTPPASRRPTSRDRAGSPG